MDSAPPIYSWLLPLVRGSNSRRTIEQIKPTMSCRRIRVQDHDEVDDGEAAEFADSVLELWGDEDEEEEPAQVQGQFKSKNLKAERRRRERLNGNLLALRAAVPNITKLSKEGTLMDAIDHIKQLEAQVVELQRELQQAPPPPSGGEKVQRVSTCSEPPKGAASTAMECQGQVEMVAVGPGKCQVRLVYMNRPRLLTSLLEAIGSCGAQVGSASTVTFMGCSHTLLSLQMNTDADEGTMEELGGLLQSRIVSGI